MRREKENFKNSNFKLSNNHANGDRNLQEGQWFRVMRHQVSGKRIVVPKKDIEVSVQDRVDNRTYAQVLMNTGSKREGIAGNHTDSIKARILKNGCMSVMVNNIPDQIRRRDSWLLFNRKRQIRDIILPKRRDKFNHRFGFLIVGSMTDAQELITSFNGTWIGRFKLTLYVARDFYGQPEHSFKKEVTGTDAKNRQRNRPQRKEALPTQVQSLGEQRVDGISENLVKQPSFRTIQGSISNGCQQLLNRSLVGSTKGSVQPDMLHAKILDRGFTFLTIRGLADKKFLISFISHDDKELDTSGISDLFLDIKVVEDCDLIVPRTTWIICDGLPLSVWNKETWELILADWGSLVTDFSDMSELATMTNGRVCIETHKVIPIDETIKVVINGLGYWVRIKETNLVFPNVRSQTWHSEVSSQCSTKKDTLKEAESIHSQSVNKSCSQEESIHIIDLQSQCLTTRPPLHITNRDHVLHLDKWENNI